MLISVSGSQRIGKTTFINDFLKEWPQYTLSKIPTYRDIAKENGIRLNKDMTKESQRLILDSLIQQLHECKRDDNIIFDRCPLDNLVYSIYGLVNFLGGIDEEFIIECRERVRKSIQKLDIIFFIPITKHNKIDLVEKDQSSVDPLFQKDINTIFQTLKALRDDGDDEYFNSEDCPPIIEIFGSREERIQMAKLYVNPSGGMYGEEDSLIYDAVGKLTTTNEDVVYNPVDNKQISQLQKYISSEIERESENKNNIIMFEDLNNK